MDIPDHVAGLSTNEARARLEQYGPNVIEEKKKSLLSRFISWVATPMSLMFVAAGGLSFWAGHTADVIIIAVLFVTNIGVGAWHEAKADTALEKLKKTLSVMVKTNRDGLWKELPSSELVPGDLIELSAGNLIPADISFVAVKNVNVNEASVTGESLPKQKNEKDLGYSGAFFTTGLALASVTATGSQTYFGKTLSLVEGNRRQSKLEKDILSISKFLSFASIIVMVLLTIVLLLAHGSIVEIATLDVSMLIAGIPVALPTVMTLIISVGVMELARRSVIVRRLSSLEDLADVDLLLSDKTGTLTENKIAVVRVERLFDVPENQVWKLALAAAPRPDTNPLDIAIETKAKELRVSGIRALDFIPGDSERKRTTAFIEREGKRIAVSLGAPQAIQDLCIFEGDTRNKYNSLVEEAAREGFRVLALAESTTDKEERMRPLALFFLADAVRPDAKETIDFMRDHGITVKMVTGDGYDVATHVARELGLKGRIVREQELLDHGDLVKNEFESVGGFAEVLPKDKYDVVMMARTVDAHHTVAVTGDGVNDVPPVKSADVGIAVANAVDALKGTADIVLTQSGISVVKDAIVEARKIFVRLYNYSVYRISESFRLIVTIAVIGFIFHTFPLTPIQIILIALLNDVPIISLAFDRVAVPQYPTSVNVRRRLALSLLFGMTGIANSLILLWIAAAFLHLPWAIIQTLFFLKLTVSGHMLVYVAHTEKPWYTFLPSKQVIWATSLTQIAATALCLVGIFVAPISWPYIIFVWVWSFLWMQVAEVVKHLQRRTIPAK